MPKSFAIVRNYLLVLLFVYPVFHISAQEEMNAPETPKKEKHEKRKISLRDTLDGAFDISNYLVNIHGFIPIPHLITEPALGGIGGGAGLVFMQPPKQRSEAVKKPKGAPMFPNTAYIGGIYTANNSWAVGGAYRGNVAKWGFQYEAGVGYADINMDIYKTFPNIGEQKFALNFRTIPVGVGVSKTLWNYFSVGLGYIFAYTKIRPNLDTMPNWLQGRDTSSQLSVLRLTLGFDNRDNALSPHKGALVKATYNFSHTGIGSNYDYMLLEVSAYGYLTFFKRWVASLRLDFQQAFQDPAFYVLPYVDLRGVPVNRYQDNIVGVIETEHRVNFIRRWSLVAFGGVGKAFPDYKSFNDRDWAYNYGLGFRYKIARLLQLEMGADVAFGPKSWAFYIIIGSAWLR